MKLKGVEDAHLCSRGERSHWLATFAELLRQGHSVVGMTTSDVRAGELESQGAEAAIVDAFDAAEVEAALRRSQAEVVIDQLTSLPKDQRDMPKYAAGDRKLRNEGGGNLFRAAIATGVRRVNVYKRRDPLAAADL